MMLVVDAIRRNWLPISALLLTAITILSLWPLATLPDVPGSDKVHHCLAYAALILPAALRRPEHWLWLALFFFVWSGAIELIQPYVNRYGEWADLAANAGGLLSGMLLGMLVNSVDLKRRNLD
ncbi:MAG: VanZ family protein [Mariprofundus sp.]